MTKVFDPDRPFIIDIWKGVDTLEELQKNSPLILDLQPMRDFYFWVVVNLSDALSFDLFILFNALLWVSTVIIFIKSLIPQKEKIFVILLIFSLILHPVAVWTISWPSAAKHLLSCFFISLSFHYFCRKQSWGYGISVFFYFLSVITQPIFVFYPVFLLVYAFEDFKSQFQKKSIIPFLLGFIMISTLIANWWYYNSVYPTQVGTTKTLPFNEFSLALNFLGISRSITQVLLPFKMAFYYSPSSSWNVVGLVVIVLFGIFNILKKNSNKVFLPLIWFFPLIVIYSKASNIFVSDTYLLIPLFSLAHFFKDLKRKLAKQIFLGFCLLFTILGIREVHLLSDPQNKLILSFKREKNCKNSLLLASQELYEVRLDSFKTIAKEAMRNNCIISGANGSQVLLDIYASSLFLDQDLSKQDKLKNLNSIKDKSSLISLYIDVLKGINEGEYNMHPDQKKYFDWVKSEGFKAFSE